MDKSWFDLSFQEKLLKAHEVSLFPERSNKNTKEFMSMIFEVLYDLLENKTDKEIKEFFKENTHV